METTETKSGSYSAIFVAARRVFAFKGRAGARIEEIVQFSGLNVRMIYHHFGSKDGLYDEVIRHSALALHHRLSEVQAQGMPGLRELLNVLCQATQDDPDLARILSWEAVSGWQTAREVVDEDRQPGALIRARIEECQKTGDIRKDVDPGLIASLMLANAFSFFLDVVQDRPQDAQQARDQFWSLISEGLQPLREKVGA